MPSWPLLVRASVGSHEPHQPTDRPTDRPCSLPPLLKETDRTASRDPPLYTYTTEYNTYFFIYLQQYIYLFIHTYTHAFFFFFFFLKEKMFLYSFLFPSSYGNVLRSSPLSCSHSLGVSRRRRRHNISRYNLQGLARTTD